MEYGARSHTEHNLVWVIIVAAVGLLVMFVAYTFWPSVAGSTTVSIGAKTFYADVADTVETRQTGLTQYSAMKNDQALLMVYEYDNVWPVSTKGLKFPVDIAWITTNKKVAYVVREAEPSSNRTYTPAGKTRYVLQLPSGSIARYGIAPGTAVKFDYQESR